MWQLITRKLFTKYYFKQRYKCAYQQLLLSQQQVLILHRRLLNTQVEEKAAVNCIVSLTSYGKRITTLHFTLYSLLSQTVRPKKIIVWLAHGETLTKELQALESLIAFKWCEDLRSYKKLVPSLALELSVPIITFDDDVIYPIDQIERLYSEHMAHPNRVICHRAHKIKLNKSQIAPYNQWEFDSTEQLPSHLLMPIGIGGVLYPVNCFADEVTNADIFMALCPTADDIWFKFMALKKGVKTKLVTNPMPYAGYLHVAGCQEQSLWSHNKGANDLQLAALINYDKTFIEMLRV